MDKVTETVWTLCKQKIHQHQASTLTTGQENNLSGSGYFHNVTIPGEYGERQMEIIFLTR